MAELFDQKLRAMRRDRAARRGVEPFLYRRALGDCVERLKLIDRRFARALLLGCLDRNAADELEAQVGSLEIGDPGPLLAKAARGAALAEEEWRPSPGAYDLIVAVGTLDTVNLLPGVFAKLALALARDGLLLGVMSGGDTLPALRSAMRAADAVQGVAAPHVHPRIEAAAVAPLLAAAGFVRPVVDVDRVPVAYRQLTRLVADLRGMAATSILTQRPRIGLSRSALAAARDAFARAADSQGRTIETFEILHFAAWSPAPAENPPPR